MREPVTVACVQAEPAILDREATIDKLASLTAEAAAAAAALVVFPETFVPAYPSSAWAKYLAGWADGRAGVPAESHAISCETARRILHDPSLARW